MKRFTFLRKLVLAAVMITPLLLGCIGCGAEKQTDTTSLSTAEHQTALTEPSTQEISTIHTESTTEPVSYEHGQLMGIIRETDEHYVLVEPLDEWQEYGSSILFKATGLGILSVEPGCVAEIQYAKNLNDGSFEAFEWSIPGRLDWYYYEDLWVDHQAAQIVEAVSYRDVVITQIFADCFLARANDSTDTLIKVNGQLEDEWCAHDWATVAFDAGFYDPETNRMEGRLVSIEEIPLAVPEKPVIYLYPEETTEVSVKLQLDGQLTCTYPAYEDSWTVTAEPDGTLTDETGMQYNYLYWEGITDRSFDLSRGFCVKGSDTASFLEDALAKLGLNRKEANEFIVYWLPMMANNPYNIISFRQEDYTETAKLDIYPEPDTLIRVFMAWRSSDCFVPLEAQKLTSLKRKGFTVIEWGGAQLP